MVCNIYGRYQYYTSFADSKAELENRLMGTDSESEDLDEPSNNKKRKRLGDDDHSMETNELRKKSKKEQQEEKKQKERAEIDAAKEIGMKWLQRKDCFKCIKLQQRVDDLQNT